MRDSAWGPRAPLRSTMNAPLRRAAAKLSFREGGGPRKENNISAVEAAFFDWLDDGWFSSRFGEGAYNDSSSRRRKSAAAKRDFFEERFEFGTEERRSAGNNDSGEAMGCQGNSIREANEWFEQR